MTTITLEVPDDLAVWLNSLREQLPLFLEQAVHPLRREKGKSGDTPQTVDSTAALYSEVLSFLTSNPTLKQIAEFKVSESVQERVAELLEKNREGSLTKQEQAEMDTYLHVNHVMSMLKLYARGSLNNFLN